MRKWRETWLKFWKENQWRTVLKVLPAEAAKIERHKGEDDQNEQNRSRRYVLSAAKENESKSLSFPRKMWVDFQWIFFRVFLEISILSNCLNEWIIFNKWRTFYILILKAGTRWTKTFLKTNSLDTHFLSARDRGHRLLPFFEFYFFPLQSLFSYANINLNPTFPN